MSVRPWSGSLSAPLRSAREQHRCWRHEDQRRPGPVRYDAPFVVVAGPIVIAISGLKAISVSDNGSGIRKVGYAPEPGRRRRRTPVFRLGRFRHRLGSPPASFASTKTSNRSGRSGSGARHWPRSATSPICRSCRRRPTLRPPIGRRSSTGA